ncbi:MAG TPA: biotin/lipoyl-binding protein [Gammaproteobacteria bacterium]
MKLPRALVLAASAALAAGCADPEPAPLVGSLEWDRIALTAELAEPVLRWAVAEGDRVKAGDVLLELDPRRQDARIAQARAQLEEAKARLEELVRGPRIETIAAARADLERARALQADAEREYVRISGLRERELVSPSVLDQALALRNQRRAETQAAEAALDELMAGTRPEQIAQAEAAVAAAQAALAQLELTRERLTVRAPRDGVVDALPFHPGDYPPVGGELVSLLVGEAPYARVFVPALRRPGLKAGDRFEVRVQGVATPFRATLRSVRSEASFTPYYALAGDDASRLVYRAELVLEGEDAASLPAGLPLTAVPYEDDGATD